MRICAASLFGVGHVALRLRDNSRSFAHQRSGPPEARERRTTTFFNGLLTPASHSPRDPNPGAEEPGRNLPSLGWNRPQKPEVTPEP